MTISFLFFTHRYLTIVSVAITIAILLTACDIETDNSLPDVPPTGRFIAVGANQHQGMQTVQVGVAIFDDGIPVKLVGGDVVQVSTQTDHILLLKRGFYEGSYAGSLENSSNFNQIDFLMVHEPIEARQDRWYPVDLLNIDPGPGELVGGSAVIVLPPGPIISAISRTTFNPVSNSFTLNWVPETAGDVIKIRALVSCTNGLKISTYGTEAKLADESDDGAETISIDQFILDINDGDDALKLIRDEARAILQELLDQNTEGTNGEDIFKTLETINPIDNSCDIDLYLFRQRPGNFASASTNGKIFGARSSNITLFYRPNLS